MSLEKFALITQPTSRPSLANTVADHIRNAILQGVLVSGERLLEDGIAEVLQVSRGPVRDALIILEQEGLVQKRPNRGTFVSEWVKKDVEEVYSLRLSLEKLAIKYAIKRSSSQHLDQMQVIIDRTAELNPANISVPEAATLDVEFHYLLCLASEHQRLISFWSNLRSQIHLFLLTRNIVASDFRQAAVDSHQELLDVILAADEAQALKTLETHLEISYVRVMNSFATNSPST